MSAHARRAAFAFLRSASRRAAPFALAATGASAFAVVSAIQPATASCAPAPARADFVSQFPAGTALRAKLAWLDDAREDLSVDRELAYAEAALLAERYNDDAQVLWRAARAAYDVEQLKDTPKDRKKAMIDEAMRLITKAKDLERNDATIYRWSGILLNEASGFGPTKDKIKSSFLVRDDWLQAVAINPYDANALHLLGRWCQSVAGLSWVERKVASTLFAEPPSSSYEEALSFFERAEKASPGFWISNAWRAAEVCVLLNRNKDALDWVHKGLKLRVKGQYDLEGKKGILELYKKLDLNGYNAYIKEHPEEAK
jgi:tetratricopeptide (TPR) repeat protein